MSVRSGKTVRKFNTYYQESDVPVDRCLFTMMEIISSRIGNYDVSNDENIPTEAYIDIKTEGS